MTRRARPVLPAVLVLLTFVAACSSGNGDDDAAIARATARFRGTIAGSNATTSGEIDFDGAYARVQIGPIAFVWSDGEMYSLATGRDACEVVGDSTTFFASLNPAQFRASNQRLLDAVALVDEEGDTETYRFKEGSSDVPRGSITVDAQTDRVLTADLVFEDDRVTLDFYDYGTDVPASHPVGSPCPLGIT